MILLYVGHDIKPFPFCLRAILSTADIRSGNISHMVYFYVKYTIVERKENSMNEPINAIKESLWFNLSIYQFILY